MGVSAYPDLFNDVFGPVMQPGSSSHTAGPCRVGVLARRLLGEEPAGIRVRLDPQGSFAGTFGLMAEDSAMIAGAMGLLPDDPRLFDAGALALAGHEAVPPLDEVIDAADAVGRGLPPALRYAAGGGRRGRAHGPGEGQGLSGMVYRGKGAGRQRPPDKLI